MVEGARLESVCRGNSTVGSNPTLSARICPFFSTTYKLPVSLACNGVLSARCNRLKLSLGRAKQLDFLP